MDMNDTHLMDRTQLYIIEHVEQLLIELACDSALSQQELKQQSQIICQLVVSPEAKQYLLQRLEQRDEAYWDKRIYQPIIDVLIH